MGHTYRICPSKFLLYAINKIKNCAPPPPPEEYLQHYII